MRGGGAALFRSSRRWFLVGPRRAKRSPRLLGRAAANGGAMQPPEFETAQARLTEILVGLADLRDGQRVLDVGCGFGGTLEAAGKWPGVQRAGVNVDRRPLDICRTLPATANPLWLALADACALPFRAASFDRLFCVEAMFHFRARDAFLREAAQVLRPDGRLVLSDILLRRHGAGSARRRRDRGGDRKRIRTVATAFRHRRRDCELRPAGRAKAREDDRCDAQTLPTYRVTAPQQFGHRARGSKPRAVLPFGPLHCASRHATGLGRAHEPPRRSGGGRRRPAWSFCCPRRWCLTAANSR